jgi:hypothetical protein
MIVAGIDPGKTGAMVILYPDGGTIVCRVPLAGKEPAWTQWAIEWGAALDLNGIDMGVIERVGSMPRQGVSSTFKFGETLGFVHAILLGKGRVPIHWPTPATWKRKMVLTNDKNVSREEARRLIPSLIPELTRVKDDGVAEAGLLAYYGRQYLA